LLSRLHGANDRVGVDKVFFLATKVSLCISVFICIALIGWGKPFVASWMGAGYEDAYLPLVVLSLAVLLDVCQSASVCLLYATFNHRFYTYVNSAEGILNLAFSLALVRRFGILGVALGTLIGALLIRIVVQPWWVCKASGFTYSRYMGFLGKNLLYCGCLMGAATAIVSWGIRPSYPWLIGSAVCATAIYAVGCWLLVFNRREREQLLETLTNRRRKRTEMQGIEARQRSCNETAA